MPQGCCLKEERETHGLLLRTDSDGAGSLPEAGRGRGAGCSSAASKGACCTAF